MLAQNNQPKSNVDIFVAGFNTRPFPKRKIFTIWHGCHTYYGMKMTMHIDDGLLARVMNATGANSKTKAIDLALREIDRRSRLAELASRGLGMTSDELKESFDPASYPETPFALAEKPVTYGRKSRSRR